MRNDFCALILSHGRPQKVMTYNSLKRAGYTGKLYIVIDDEDKTADEYFQNYPGQVIQFCKSKYAAMLDEGDNTGSRISTMYARRAMFDIAPELGCKYFIQLDDDYTSFSFRHNEKGEYDWQAIKTTCDDVFEAMVNFADQTNCKAVCMCQGGDFIGGGSTGLRLKRKAMNSFVCSTDRPWQMFGRMNEDVNTYVLGSLRGELWFSTTQLQLNQLQTQRNAGGMSTLYLSSGTYVKSFYSVMYAPACVQIGTLGDPRSKAFRIHHKINWNNTAPKILREEWRKDGKRDSRCEDDAESDGTEMADRG